MRRNLVLLGVAALLLGGCDTGMMYSRSAPQMPVRWPDNIKLCGVISAVVVPLKTLVTYNMIPFIPVQYYPGAQPGAGCGYTEGDKAVVFTDRSFLSPHTDPTDAMNVDNGSHYRTYQVRYNFMLAKDNRFTRGQYYNPHWTSLLFPILTPAAWRHSAPIGKPVTVTINGLAWKHYLFYTYKSASPKPGIQPIPVSYRSFGKYEMYPLPVVKVKYPRALRWVGEVYAHRVDAHHKMLVWAQYDRAVTQDAHWFKVREHLLRKLVDAVTIKPLTSARLKQLQAQQHARDAPAKTASRQ